MRKDRENSTNERKEFTMYEERKRSIKHRMAALVMTLTMVLSLTVCSFASGAQTYNADITEIIAAVSYKGQSYTVIVSAPPDTTYISVEATLYQKQLLGRKEISSFTDSINGRVYSKSHSAEIKEGKTYILEVTAQMYTVAGWDTLEKTITVNT